MKTLKINVPNLSAISGKRQKIILTSTVLTIGLLSTQVVNFDLRFKSIAVLALLTYILSVWSLWEGLNRMKAVVLMVLPVFFTVAVSSFYFLLPVRWLTRLPIVVVFGLLFYLLLLSQNVFNVASIRTIPLYRAASTATFLFTLLSAFFIFNVLFSLNMLFIWNGIAVAVISFLLILQVLWSINMEDRISASVFIQSVILGLGIGELAIGFSFWPITQPSIWALVLSSAMYVSLGLTTHYLKEKSGSRIVIEYLGIGITVLAVAFYTTSWIG